MKNKKGCDIWSLGVIGYILLCGYPPFYSAGENDLTDEMKGKIRAGEYQFDPISWKNISNEAKTLIEQMLIVDPTKRININQIRHSSWFNQKNSLRQIDLTSIQDQHNRHQIQVTLLAFFL